MPSSTTLLNYTQNLILSLGNRQQWLEIIIPALCATAYIPEEACGRI